MTQILAWECGVMLVIFYGIERWEEDRFLRRCDVKTGDGLCDSF